MNSGASTAGVQHAPPAHTPPSPAASTAPWTVAEILEATGGALRGGSSAASIRGISTDSRHLQSGQAFLAIRGPQFDGHAFGAAAVARGASALIVQAGQASSTGGTVPVIAVPDTTAALGALARAHRRRVRVPVIAVTGSCGKTTTKEMLAAVLGARYRVLASVGTENNQYGVPQTLLRLMPAHEVVILELGTNHPGEIARLAAIAEPTIGVLTNIGLAHLEFLGSLGGVLHEKTALLRALGADGTAIVNGDDPVLRCALIEHPPAGALLRFGTGRHCDLQARRIEPLALGTRCVVDGALAPTPFPVALSLLGHHQVLNALAAITCGLHLGVPSTEIARALAAMPPVPMRLEPLRVNGLTILNDCYNANPVSMRQALEVLRQYPGERPTVFVCGDMGELGPGTRAFHREVGRWARESQVDVVVAVGTHAASVAEGVASGRDRRDGLWACATLAEAEARLDQLALTRGTVLVKGSRAMGLERLVARLMESRA